MRAPSSLLLPLALTFLVPAQAIAAQEPTLPPDPAPALPPPPPAPPPPVAAGDEVVPTATPDEPIEDAPKTASDTSALADDGHPLAGWHNGLFYLRDYTDNFRLYLQGRAQIDAYTYFGPGVAETTLKPTLFLRRIRPELSGEFLGNW